MFGGLAAIGMGAGFVADVGVMLGGIVGLVCSPALMFGLRHGPWLLGLVFIAVPTAVAAFIDGRLTPPNGGPLLSLFLAVSVYLLASYVRGRIGLKWYPPPGPNACIHCAYDRTGLAPDAVCPECGAPPPIV